MILPPLFFCPTPSDLLHVCYIPVIFCIPKPRCIRLQCRRPQFDSWVREFCWRRDRLPTPLFLDFPCVSAGRESACNAGDLGLIRGLGSCPGEGKGYPLQYSGLENSMALIVHGVTKSRTRLRDLHSLKPRRALPEGRHLLCLPSCLLGPEQCGTQPELIKKYYLRTNVPDVGGPSSSGATRSSPALQYHLKL